MDMADLIKGFSLLSSLNTAKGRAEYRSLFKLFYESFFFSKL